MRYRAWDCHSSDEWLHWKVRSKAVHVTLSLRAKAFQLPGPGAWSDALSKPAHLGEEKAVQPEQKT